MRIVLTICIATLLLLGATMVAIGPATAGTTSATRAVELPTMVHAKKAGRHCVSKREFRKAKRGWRARKVHGRFDTKGRIIFAAPNPGTMKFTTRQYRACAGPKRGALTVDFENGRLIGKHLVFTSRRDSPKCVSNGEFRRIKRGMSPRRVARIADTAGGFLDGGGGGYARGYDLCAKTSRAKHAVVVYVWRGGRSDAVKVYSKRRTNVRRR